MLKPARRVLVYSGEGAGKRCALSLRNSLSGLLSKHGVQVNHARACMHNEGPR